MMDDEALKHLKARNDERRRRSLETETSWPPADAVRFTTTAGYPGAITCQKYDGISQMTRDMLGMGDGWFCGYLALPKTHPCFGRWYDDIECDVHGGLTFCQLGTDGLFWIGFDTAHYQSREWNETLVRAEVERLAEQMLRLDVYRVTGDQTVDDVRAMRDEWERP